MSDLEYKGDFLSTLRWMIQDWKSKQNRSSFECGVELEKEIARFGKGEISALSRLERAEKMLDDIVDAFQDECMIPPEKRKAVVLRAATEYTRERKGKGER